ncbi:alcohol dehydrogenase catalytic domain-containing protein [Microbacterium sp.]|uniref:alcohol dehydrogenase catalytic domain-containing protein n=1 Tax=Microbacterium sp. TaxID=51671 RepID=UPI003A8D30F1
MIIRGAVLEASGRSAPYAESEPIVIRDLELDAPGPTELLVRIEAAGICHSDLSVVNGSRPRAVPLLLGHEAAGIVEAVGSDVTDIAPGRRVVLTFLPRCGQCAACATDGRAPCIPGSAANGEGRLLAGGKRLHDAGRVIDHHLGVSAFADHAVVDRRSVVPVDDDIPAEVAALLGCAVLTGGGAVINAARLQPGESLAVVGLGGVGMAAVLAGLAVDGVEVIGVDAQPGKLETARQLGATAADTPDQAADAGVQADVVVEAVGRAVAFETALALTAPGGRTVTVGLPDPHDLATVSPLHLVAGGRTVIGSYMGSSVPARDIPRFAALWREGRLPVERLVSGHVDLDHLNAAMDALASGTAMRQIIRFDSPSAE